MKGTVVSISCGMYKVECDGTIYQTSPRGIFRHTKGKIYVGDIVNLEEDHFLIESIETRHSFIKRPAIANIDQILIVLSLKEPDFSYYLACKYITFANYNGIKCYLVLTKSDIDSSNLEKQIIDDFTKIGVETFAISNKTKEGLSKVKELLANKCTCLLGQSGVGKSSLLNSLDENYNRSIGNYSLALGRGKHQTKEVILLPCLGGYIADTPGFSSLEIDLDDKQVAKFFPGFMDYSINCFYSDCLHVSENKCLIKKAVDEGKIPSIIYECYLKLLQEVKEL